MKKHIHQMISMHYRMWDDLLCVYSQCVSWLCNSSRYSLVHGPLVPSILMTCDHTHTQVKYVEQQTIRKMAKKGYAPPTDPGWSQQWSLVNIHCDYNSTSVVDCTLFMHVAVIFSNC